MLRSRLLRLPLLRPPLLRFCSGTPTVQSHAALDSLSVLRKLEASGLDAPSSEAVTTSLLDAVRASAQADAARYATIEASTRDAMIVKAEMERLKSEIADLRKELKIVQDKSKTDLRYEIEKLQASQRLDLNLEKGRIREDFQKQSDLLMKADARIDREVNQVRTQIEASKNDLLRYSIGTIVSFVAVSLAALRQLM